MLDGVEGDNAREVNLLKFIDFEVGMVTVFAFGLMPVIWAFIP